MTSYKESFQEELKYLEWTLEVLKREINKMNELLSHRRNSLKASRKDMWENSVHFSDDFDRLTEVTQYLSEVKSQTAAYSNTATRLERHKRIMGSPYFGRFDFTEARSSEREKIYVGLGNVIDPETNDILVYDWRAPVSSIFYRCELGNASYKAPCGTINGNVSLKRQYRIQNSQLKYFFDCSVKINDEVLQEVLCRNSSPKMKNIVETIQREQDTIIRDIDNELLIVQGVAGSGKTSIAMHRIAFLLYHGLNSNINNKNMLIISPNALFSNYISNVLPELGEENVNQIVFEDYAVGALNEKGKVETRKDYLEHLITSKNTDLICLKKQSFGFKGSGMFTEILDRFISYYIKHMICFEDVYYDGKIIESRHSLKNFFLNNNINIPVSKKLKRIENMILNKIHPIRKDRLGKIEKFVEESGWHELEIKPYSRLLSIKESKALLRRIRRFTEIDYYSVYKLLFEKGSLLKKISRGLDLPHNIEQIIKHTRDNLKEGFISYEDYAPLLYLKLKLEGNDSFTGIRHVVIDEAQDYSIMHYKVFNLLFKNASYTVLGDINQSIDKELDTSLYDEIVELFNKNKSVKLFLNKSYRSSFEINTFCKKLLNKKLDIVPFERHEDEPAVIGLNCMDSIYQRMIQDINGFLGKGYESIAIICKTVREARDVYKKLGDLVSIKFVGSSDEGVVKGVIVIPAYMAKGLEFDAVLVFNVSEDNYSTELDKRLLYIACTRALHRLNLYYTGYKSCFI